LIFVFCDLADITSTKPSTLALIVQYSAWFVNLLDPSRPSSAPGSRTRSSKSVSAIRLRPLMQADNRFAPLQELGAVSPVRIGAVGQRDL
jgi:hypothetical protein